MTPLFEKVYPENQEKSCTDCGVSKALTEFHRNKNSRDGRCSYCKKCRNVGRQPYVPSLVKTCNTCKEERPASEFRPRIANGKVLRSQCDPCRRSENNAKYKQKQDYDRRRNKEWREKNRDILLAKESERRRVNKHQINAARKRWDANNPEKSRATRKRFNETHPTYQRDVYIKRKEADPEKLRREASDSHFKKFGVDQEWYDTTLAGQGYACMICGRPDSGVTGRRFAIDHDHSCCGYTKACEKCRRGLLCLTCNTWIAGLEKYPRLAKRALWYLNKFANKDGDASQYHLFSA